MIVYLFVCLFDWFLRAFFSYLFYLFDLTASIGEGSWKHGMEPNTLLLFLFHYCGCIIHFIWRLIYRFKYIQINTDGN